MGRYNRNTDAGDPRLSGDEKMEHTTYIIGASNIKRSLALDGFAFLYKHLS